MNLQSTKVGFDGVFGDGVDETIGQAEQESHRANANDDGGRRKQAASLVPREVSRGKLQYDQSGLRVVAACAECSVEAINPSMMRLDFSSRSSKRMPMPV